MRDSVRRLTPPGAGGVAVLEVRGPEALASVARLTRRPPRPGRLSLLVLEEAGELVDEALVWAESAERCEVHLHASPPLVEHVRRALGGEEPERPRDPPSLEEEAWEQLARAPGEAAARMLLDQAEGSLRAAFEELLSASDPVRGARELLARSRVGRCLVHPPRVVLRGPVNAGKSTLFNALVGHERALVHAEEGTTRDAVLARASLAGYVFDLVDTAGERELAPGDPLRAVERAGQGLGRSLARSAAVVVRVHPAAAFQAAPAARSGEVRVASRADEWRPGHGPPADACLVSALRDPTAARQRVGEALREVLGLPRRAWSAGEPVPFTAEAARALEALARGQGGAHELLGALLERGTPRAGDSLHPAP